MKSCPSCNRTFDDTLSFCLEDGAVLSPSFTPDPVRGDKAPPTEVMHVRARNITETTVDKKAKKRRSAAHKKKHSPKKAILAEKKEAPDGYRLRHVFRELLRGFLLIVLVLAIKMAAETTSVAKHLDLMSYNLLQTQLSSETPPITVVDISDLAPKDFVVAGKTVTATPRDALAEMVKAITSQQPKAVGIDIDLSPDEAGYILPNDPQFFQRCISLSKQTGVPVFLGIGRSIPRPADEWLGEEAYQDLAANILIPKDSRRMLNVLEIRDFGNPETASATHQASISMSARLADAYGRETGGRRVHSWLARYGLVEMISDRPIGAGITAQDFLVDYGSLESIPTIRTTNPVVLADTSQRNVLQGKVVLLGDASLGKATDTFVVPGRDQPVPGVYLHAAATYTLMKAPLYELTGKGHIIIDVLLSALILLAILILGFRYGNEEEREHATGRFRGLLTWMVVLGAILIGVVSVHVTRIMWDDFFLALILLVFHPSIERQTEALWKRVRNRGLRASTS